ncbi:MAG: tRNA lysidine(34) synthetase TilS, partial [Myxococcota bacterium]
MSCTARLEGAHAELERWRGRRAVLGWSGGLDSTVLLHLAREHGLDVHAVHVDHGLRPSSARDAAFCARRARRWGIPMDIERIHVRGSGSSQERARLQRYASLAGAALRTGAARVLTAHHGEDAIETALINRERGAHEFGLTALLRRDERGPIPAWPAHVSLERPLLGLLRRDIERYAAEHALTWIDDPTNATTNYRRNEIRHELLPALTDDGADTGRWLAALEDMAKRAERWQDEAVVLLDGAMLAPLDAESRALAAAPLAAASEPACVRALHVAAS